MRLMTRISDPEVHLTELQEIIESDVGLTVKLLKMAGSLRGSQAFQNVLEVLQLFGLSRVKSWVSILAAAELNPAHPEILREPLIRAHFLECFASQTAAGEPSTFYLAGMLSALDLLMQMPLDRVLAELPLDAAFREMLLRREGALGEGLRLLELMERDMGEAVPEAMVKCFLQAVVSANQLLEPLMRR